MNSAVASQPAISGFILLTVLRSLTTSESPLRAIIKDDKVGLYIDHIQFGKLEIPEPKKMLDLLQFLGRKRDRDCIAGL